MVIAAPVPVIRELREPDIPALVALGELLGSGENIDSWRRIRELREPDIPALVALGELLGSGENIDSWRRRLAEGDLVAICAQQDGALVGYAAGSVRRSFGLETAGWIEAFGVANAWRGRGLGRTLALALLARFRAVGARHAYTIVPVHDLALQPFFRDLGFRGEPIEPLGRTL
jgi:ribosomal protein S18 acetylase RimI-like enzyme